MKYSDHPLNIALRDICGRLGYDYRRVADILDLPDKTVYNWFLGHSRPSRETLLYLSTLERYPSVREDREAECPPLPKKPRGKPYVSKN